VTDLLARRTGETWRVPGASPVSDVRALPLDLSNGEPALPADTDVLALAVGAPEGGAGPRPGPGSAALVADYGVDLDAVLAAERVGGRVGEVLRVPVASPAGLPPRLLLVGVGSGGPAQLRRAGAALARAVRGRARVATTLGAGAGPEAVRALVEGLVLGGWTPPATGLRPREDSAAAGLVLLLGDHAATAVAAGLRHAAATGLTRDLAATPSSVKNPAWLAEQAVALAGVSGLEVEVWDAERLAREGFGGLVAVGAGSPTPPALVQLRHTPPGASGRRPAVLVGKGITFDTGGLSIKPRESMVPMKTDMSGAAAVLAALAGCAAAGVTRPVVGLLALAENAFGGASYRPGDVVRHYGGRTTEVANTDAEGRLVLADALAYADARLDPEVLVDIATLTGAATLGLGRRHSALYATDDGLAAALEQAGRDSGEAAWRMPLVEEYRAAIDSDVADLRQVSNDPRLGGGSITAALFLREFAAGRPWAHLDVAGTARADKDEYEITKGATGYGARLLLRWLEAAD
jgi:leucyl aminopeptidase